MSRAFSHRSVVLVVVSLVLAGCSTTVRIPTTAGAANAAQGGTGTEEAASAPSVSSTAISGATANQVTTVPGRGAASTIAATGAGKPAVGSSATASGAGIGGATAATCTTPMAIGADYSADVGAALAAVGATNSSNSVPNGQQVQAGYQAGIEWLNKNGGLGGCPAKLVLYNWSSFGDWDASAQQLCTFWAEDN